MNKNMNINEKKLWNSQKTNKIFAEEKDPAD